MYLYKIKRYGKLQPFPEFPYSILYIRKNIWKALQIKKYIYIYKNIFVRVLDRKNLHEQSLQKYRKKKKSHQIEHYKFEKLFHSKLFFSLQLSREKIIPEHDQYIKISYYLRITQNIYNIHKKFIPAGGGEITYAVSISISWKSHASTNGIVITTDHLLHFFPRRTIPPCLFLEIDEIRYFFLPSSIA